MVQQTPFVGDDSTFITGSKISAVASIDTVTGSVTKLNGICDENVDTCQNITTVPEMQNNSNSLLLVVINEYKLSAVSLKSMKVIWSIDYSELLDVTNNGENIVLTSSHLGYDLCLKGLTTLKAIPQVLSSDDWEFDAESPIIGVYQVIRGARFVKIKLSSDDNVQGKLTVYNYSSTLFVMESIKGQTRSKEFEGITIPYSLGNKLEELEGEANDNSEITYTQLVIAGLLGVLTAVIICVLFSKYGQKEHAEEVEKKTEDEKITKEVKANGPVVQVGTLTICTNVILGYGSLGTIVYEGRFDHRTVAIKRMLRPFHEVATKEISALIVADNHPHVIRYFTKEEDR